MYLHHIRKGKNEHNDGDPVEKYSKYEGTHLTIEVFLLQGTNYEGDNHLRLTNRHREYSIYV